MKRMGAQFFRVCELWGAGFKFLLVLSVVGMLAFLAGSALAWLLFLLLGWKNEDGEFNFGVMFAAVIAPYFVGRTMPTLRQFTGNLS